MPLILIAGLGVIGGQCNTCKDIRVKGRLVVPGVFIKELPKGYGAQFKIVGPEGEVTGINTTFHIVQRGSAS